MGSAVFAAVSGLLTPVPVGSAVSFPAFEEQTAASDKQKNDRKISNAANFSCYHSWFTLVLNI